MPIPLQTLITLPLYDRLYMYIKLSVSGNEKNEKAAAERENKFRCTKRKFYLQTENSVTETVDPQTSSRQQLLK